MLGVSEIELGEPWIVDVYVASTMWHHFARYLPVNQQRTGNNELSNSTIQVDILIRFNHKYLCCFPKRWLPSGCYDKAATHVQSFSSGLSSYMHWVCDTLIYLVSHAHKQGNNHLTYPL